MKRNEFLNKMSAACETFTTTLVSTINELRVDMNTKVAQMAKLRSTLKEDNEAMSDIFMVMQDFIGDMQEINHNVKEVADTMDNMFIKMDTIPNELVVKSDEEED